MMNNNILKNLTESDILECAENIMKKYNQDRTCPWSKEDIKSFIQAKMKSLETELAILEESEHIEDLQDMDLI